MLSVIIVIVVILALVSIGYYLFYSYVDKFSNCSGQSAQPTQLTQSTKPTLYVFKSTTCPACKMYDSSNGPIVQKIVNKLGLEIHEVNLDSDTPMDSTTKDVYDKCGVQFIPTACLVKSNGEVKQLGNGNSLNEQIIKSAI